MLLYKSNDEASETPILKTPTLSHGRKPIYPPVRLSMNIQLRYLLLKPHFSIATRP